MTERTRFKKQLIEFYRKEKEYNFRDIEPSQLGFERDADKTFFNFYRGELRKELIKEKKLRPKNTYDEYYLEYVKSSKKKTKLFGLSVAGILTAIFIWLHGKPQPNEQ